MGIFSKDLPGVDSLRHNDESQSGIIPFFDSCESFLNLGDLVLQHLTNLSIANSVTVKEHGFRKLALVVHVRSQSFDQHHLNRISELCSGRVQTHMAGVSTFCNKKSTLKIYYLNAFKLPFVNIYLVIDGLMLAQRAPTDFLVA